MNLKEFLLENKSLFKDLGKEYIICGGSVYDYYLENNLSTDIDIFFFNQEAYDKYMLETSESLTQGWTNGNATAKNLLTAHIGRVEIQLIKVNQGTPEEILSRFDLNKSQCYVDSVECIPKFHRDFHKDLFFYEENFKFNTGIRFIKYINKDKVNKDKNMALLKSDFRIDKILSSNRELFTFYGELVEEGRNPIVSFYNQLQLSNINLYERIMLVKFDDKIKIILGRSCFIPYSEDIKDPEVLLGIYLKEKRHGRLNNYNLDWSIIQEKYPEEMI